MTVTIAVGSKNPAKINAVQIAFEKIHPQDKIQIYAFDVESGVPAQPMTTSESIQGARNRASNALQQCAEARFGIGLEGGLEKINDVWFDAGWCVILDHNGLEGIASSARIPTPKIVIDKIQEGFELGEVIDQLFETKNAKQNQGHFGLMTNNAVTRTEGYVHAVCLAYSRFLHPGLF